MEPEIGPPVTAGQLARVEPGEATVGHGQVPSGQGDVGTKSEHHYVPPGTYLDVNA